MLVGSSCVKNAEVAISCQRGRGVKSLRTGAGRGEALKILGLGGYRLGGGTFAGGYFYVS